MASILPENVLHPYVENAKCDLQDFDEQAEGIGLQEAGTELKELAMNSLRDASTELHMQAGVLTSFKRPEDLVETPDVWACCITKAMMDDVQAERPGEVVVLKGMGMPCCGCLCPTTGAIVQDPDGRVKHVHKQLGCFACCCTCCQGGAENYLEITERPVLEKTISPVHAGNRRKGQLMLALILGLYAVAPASSSGSSSPTSSVSSSGASSSTDTTGTTGQYPSPDETGGAIPISPSRRWHDGYGHSAPPTPATTNAPTNAPTNPDDTTGTTGTTVAEFLVGAQGTNVCPDGWVSVGTEAECQSAATTLGYTRQSRVYGYYDDLPKGCFHDAHGDAHFNSHETGAADSAATPICAGACSGPRVFMLRVSVHVCVCACITMLHQWVPLSFVLSSAVHEFLSLYPNVCVCIIMHTCTLQCTRLSPRYIAIISRVRATVQSDVSCLFGHTPFEIHDMYLQC